MKTSKFSLLRRVFLLILVFPLALRSAPLPPRHYFFNHLTKSSGLVSYQVNSMVQDNEGFIWIGTNEGLQRFDGIHYRNFQHSDNDVTSIPSNFVRQLLMGKDGSLWMLSTDGKVALFDRHRFTAVNIPVTTKAGTALLSNANINKLIGDEYGGISLLIEGYELLTYNPGSRTFSATANFPALPPGIAPTAFVQEPGTHRYWYATDSAGIAVCDLATASPDAQKIADPVFTAMKATRNISTIWFDRQHRLWTVNNVNDLPEINCYDLAHHRPVLLRYRLDARSLGHHEVRSFYEARDGSIWISGQQVLAKFIEKSREFEQVYNGDEEEHGIDYVMITCLLEDREEGMWVGTANNGLFYFYHTMELFSNVTYTSNLTGKKGQGAPGSFLADEDGTLLAGIRDEGLYRFNRELKQIPLNISGIPEANALPVSDMRNTGDHIGWIAVTHGFFRYNPTQRSTEAFFPKLFQHLTVSQVCPDKSGNLWIGTLQSGLFFWDRILGAGNFENGLRPVAGVSSNRINQIIKDSRGRIWVATVNEGVYIIEPDNGHIVRHFSATEKGSGQLKETSVNALKECGDSLMVIAGPRVISWYHYRDDSLQVFPHRLTGNVMSMESDHSGHLWVSTSSTLFRISPSSQTYIYYDRSDGLANDGFLSNASTSFTGNRLLFGVYGAIISFVPENVLTGPVTPDLQLTEVTVSGKQLRVDSLVGGNRFTLAPDDNNISFAFSAMVYNSGYLMRYRLEGLGDDWKPVSRESGLNFPFLPPGDYKLTVEAEDADGRSVADKVRVSFRIRPHFWQTIWFYAILVLLLGGIIFWLDRMRNRRRLAVQTMRSDIGLGLARDVSTALNDINVLSEMANLKAAAEPERAREYLVQIRKKSAGMITAMGDMIWSIDPQNDTLGKTIDRLREFAEFLNNGNDATITIASEDRDTGRKLNMQSRHEILFLLKEHLAIVAQCGARNIDAHLSTDQDLLIYHLQFATSECRQEALNTLLFALNLEQRRDAARSRLVVDQRPTRTVVEVKIPLS